MDQVDGSRESSHLERDGAQDNSTAEETKLKNSAKLLGGRVACVVGLLLSAASVIAALLGASADISGGALGIVLGGVGYYLGSRRLGSASCVVGVVAIFLAVSLGGVGWL